jgi:hypothetical protein
VKISRFLAIVIALLMSASFLSQAQPSAPTLPSVTAYNLLKSKVTLPKDLSTPASLLVLSFLHNQQAETDSWVKLDGSLPGLRIWSLPVYTRENVIYRWWMNSSLRSATHDSHAWGNTVPLYVNKPEFLKTLQIHSEREVVVLLVNRSGTVLWRSTGLLTQEKRDSLAAAVAAIKP